MSEKVGFVCCGGFKRLAADVGSFYSYFKAEKAGRVPRPHFITGASAGAVASAVVLPWTEENFKKATKAVINLNQKNIYSFDHWLELYGALSIGESVLVNFIPALHRDSQQTTYGRILLELSRATLSVASKFWLFWEFLKQPSIFSSEPLRHLLRHSQNRLNFEAIWNSDIKLEIPAVDLKTNQMVYFTNYLSEHRQLPNRDDVLVNMVRGSASVPAFLPAISLGKHLLDDAALLNNLPLERAILAGCDTIFVLLQQPYLEKPKEDKPVDKITWVEELNQAMDIAVGRSTELTLQWHEKINQDLEMIEEAREVLAQMPANTKTAHLKVLLERLSASGFKKTKIITVIGNQPLPSLTFNDFHLEDQKLGYEIGCQNMQDILDKNFP